MLQYSLYRLTELLTSEKAKGMGISEFITNPIQSANVN